MPSAQWYRTSPSRQQHAHPRLLCIAGASMLHLLSPSLQPVSRARVWVCGLEEAPSRRRPVEEDSRSGRSAQHRVFAGCAVAVTAPGDFRWLLPPHIEPAVGGPVSARPPSRAQAAPWSGCLPTLLCRTCFAHSRAVGRPFPDSGF